MRLHDIANGGVEAQNWTGMLYNRPVSLLIDYFIINLKDSEARTDFEASSFPARKLKSKSDENEAAIKNGVDYEPIGCEWMFGVLKARYREPAGRPIVRITKQLGEMETVIIRELGVGCEIRKVSGIGLGRKEGTLRVWVGF